MTAEALIVGALLLLALENTMAAVSASGDISGHQKRMTEVTHVGQSLMEELMGAYDTDADLTAGAHTAEFDADGNRIAGAQYRADWQITPGSPLPGIRTIELTLTWTEKGIQRMTTFMTYRN
jgi:hypothetical protein